MLIRRTNLLSAPVARLADGTPAQAARPAQPFREARTDAVASEGPHAVVPKDAAHGATPRGLTNHGTAPEVAGSGCHDLIAAYAELVLQVFGQPRPEGEPPGEFGLGHLTEAAWLELERRHRAALAAADTAP